MLRYLLPFATCLAVVAADSEPASEGRFLQNTRQLILEGKRSGEGYFSPDGKKLIFQSEREEGNPFYQIYVLDFETGETNRVSPGVGKTTCAFFQPGQSRVLFSSTHADPEAKARQQAEIDFRASGKLRRYSWDYDATMEIYSAGLDGKDIRPLTQSLGYDAEASYSPDGKQIVFCSLRSAYPQDKLTPEQRARFEKDPAYWGEIYIMDAEGGNVKRLTEAPGYDGGPFFSPKGDRIIWRHFDESGMVAEVWTMKTDGTDKKRLTEFKAMSWAPYFHPSGDYVIFTSNKLGFENFELFMVDAEGTKEPVRVTYTDGFDGLPVFSPDGKKLAWSSGRTADKKAQLFIGDWNDAEARKALEAAPKRAVKADVAPGEKADPLAAARAKAMSDMEESSWDPFKRPYDEAIKKLDLTREVQALASEKWEGRATGSDGAKSASEWLGKYFEKAGLMPLPGKDNYFQPFEFPAGDKLIPGQNALSVATAANPHETKPGAPLEFAVEKDFRPLAFSENGEIEGDVVFAGYGLTAPNATNQLPYNSYEGLDVKDKVVLLLRYVPEQVEAPRRAHLNRYAGLRYKVMMARERGAKAVLVVTGPNSPGAGEVLGLSGDGSSSASGLPAASVSMVVADKLLAATGKTLKDLQGGLDNENPHAVGGFAIPGAHMKMKVDIEHLRKMDRNVVAVLPRTPMEGVAEEWVIIGAHYDHLGRGRSGSNSLARKDEEGKIHYGADDNASGTAMVMEIAAALAKEKAEHPEKFRRNIAFCLWSGEEMGLLGSAAFVEKPPFPLKDTVAYFNADMVGRLRDNKLIVQAVGSSKAWPKLLEKRNVAAGFALTLQEDPYLPTDVTSFYPKRVPVLNFFTGSHDDYHRPTDTADKVNYEGLERITILAKNLVLDVAQAPERIDFSRIERKEQGGGSRDNLRAYLGTIPDYATEVKGVKISGTRAGSPAEKAGLKGGDVIVEFAGQKIANIYDYTYALDAVKIGKAVKIVVERDGKREEITATPEQRK